MFPNWPTAFLFSTSMVTAIGVSLTCWYQMREAKHRIPKISAAISLIGAMMTLVFSAWAGWDNVKAQQQGEERIEALRQDNLKLEAQIAPRRLSDEDAKKITEQLRQFSGRTVRVVSYTGDAESAILAFQIAHCVSLASLKLDDELLSVQPFRNLAMGIFIDGTNRALRAAIFRALQAAGMHPIMGDPKMGVDSFAMTSAGVDLAKPEDVDVFVGVKPIAP
jgi:hypothetical protein